MRDAVGQPCPPLPFKHHPSKGGGQKDTGQDPVRMAVPPPNRSVGSAGPDTQRRVINVDILDDLPQQWREWGDQPYGHKIQRWQDCLCVVVALILVHVVCILEEPKDGGTYADNFAWVNLWVYGHDAAQPEEGMVDFALSPPSPTKGDTGGEAAEAAEV